MSAVVESPVTSDAPKGTTDSLTAATCEKCGGTDIYRAYHKQGCEQKDCSCATCGYGDHAKAHGEHLHYHCRGCHFDWVGPVLGRKKVAGVIRG